MWHLGQTFSACNTLPPTQQRRKPARDSTAPLIHCSLLHRRRGKLDVGCGHLRKSCLVKLRLITEIISQPRRWWQYSYFPTAWSWELLSPVWSGPCYLLHRYRQRIPGMSCGDCEHDRGMLYDYMAVLRLKLPRNCFVGGLDENQLRWCVEVLRQWR